MAKTTIIIPVSIGDTIYEKCTKVKSCRYFGDKYAHEDGQPHCLQHEYDCAAPCDSGEGCDAIFEYYVKPVKVNDSILLNFAREVIEGEPNKWASKKYLLTNEEVEKWILNLFLIII